MRIIITEEGKLKVSVEKCETLKTVIESPKVLKTTVQGVVPYTLVSSEKVVVEKIAGETIGSHKIVKLGNDGYLYYASCDNLDDVERILGLSLNSADPGGSVRVLTFGRCEDTSFNFDVSKPIYLGKNGAVVQDIDNGTVFIQRLGRVLKNNEILIDLDEPIIIS